MIFGDFGTSYTKVWDIECEAVPRIVRSTDIPCGFRTNLATGHNGARFGERYVNELTALARGAKKLIEEDDFVILDCGSRDLKFVRFSGDKVRDTGWNAECGASLGFTIELLERYYDLDYRQMPVPSSHLPVICGVLGLSHIFDAIIQGARPEEAVASFIKGIALNAYRFAGSPPKVYLSGGLSENPVFVKSIPCEVVVLGRFVLLEGLRYIASI